VRGRQYFHAVLFPRCSENEENTNKIENPSAAISHQPSLLHSYRPINKANDRSQQVHTTKTEMPAPASQQQTKQHTVLIAGSTGYAGRYLVEEYSSRPNYTVKALVRHEPSPPFPDKVQLIIGEVTKPSSLEGIMCGVDICISAVGITRQRDGVTYHDVDYQANMNLVEQAEKSGVSRFGYIHVLHGDILADSCVGVAAKQAFVDSLQASKNMQSTVVCPSGFFSDMNDFLDMAKSGRVYLFGDGHYRLNPIHGADLAKATADAIERGVTILPVGGPDIYTHTELGTMALEVMKKPMRITYLWDGLRRMLASCLPWITPVSIYGPAQLFFAAFGMDMIGECKGTHHLKDTWLEKVSETKE
jgi:uncharacterized protein YbjT (DUF2867 family)